MENMSTVEAAAHIRSELKKLGISSRKVSVKSDLYSMGSSIRILIKDGSIKKSTVEKIARGAEQIHWDHFAGEILSGGNRFVDVEYSMEALAPLRAEFEAAIGALPTDGTVGELRGGEFTVCNTMDRIAGGYVTIWDRAGNQVVNCWGVDFAARQLAEKIADGYQSLPCIEMDEAIAAAGLNARPALRIVR